jgi:hypothetical protein
MSTLRFVCSKQDCTVAVTGKCLELHNPSECPNATTATSAAGTEKPTTTLPVAARKFPPATELGIRDALTITGGRYAHLVAVLGATDAGKTCMLNALYLLALHAGLLPRFRFAGSLTLAGFELRTRRLRKWQKGQLPGQLAEHTSTSHADPRNPGLLHLALSDMQNGNRRVELLLTDLPGEWTTGLIKQSQTSDKFAFLQRADGLVIAVDGPKLLDAGQKHVELLNLRQLIDRLADKVNLNRATPVFIAVCKGDEAGLAVPQGLDEIVEHARSKGFGAHAVVIASFSRKPKEVENGHGIRELVEAIIDHQSPTTPRTAISPEPQRSFGRSLGLA